MMTLLRSALDLIFNSLGTSIMISEAASVSNYKRSIGNNSLKFFGDIFTVWLLDVFISFHAGMVQKTIKTC